MVCLILASIEAMSNKDESAQVATTMAYELLRQIKQALKMLAGSPF